MKEKDFIRFRAKIQKGAKPEDCWLWMGSLDPAGYGRFGLDGVNRLAHVLAFEHYKGQNPFPCVCHRCDNPRCVNPNHMFGGTQSDNVVDAIKKGRQGVAKLDVETVKKIRERFANGYKPSLGALAEEFGVSKMTISLISRNKIWRFA